jgi:SAM-dependent methyltransferase
MQTETWSGGFPVSSQCGEGTGSPSPPPRPSAGGRPRRTADRGRLPDPAQELPEDRLTPEELRIICDGVKRLSQGLTRERELAGARYMDDPTLLGAYLLFYWPVSYAQARATMAELPARPDCVLDLGSGPGPMAFAAIDAGARTVLAADRSAAALELARQLALEAEESLGTREWSPERPLPEGQFDLITLGHVLNELHGKDVALRASLVSRVMQRLRPGGTLLAIEPALRETARALLEVRDALVAKGHAVRAPCLFHGPCPALAKPGDWCHAERAWREPPLIQAIARGASLHKEALKMAYLLAAPLGEAWPVLPEQRLFRIVSEPLEGKGRQRLMGCGPEGRVGLALQDKHRTATNERFFTLTRGDVIAVSDTEARGDGVSLTERSTVALVARAGSAVPPTAPPSPR